MDPRRLRFYEHPDLRKRVLESSRWKDTIRTADSTAYGSDCEPEDSVDQDTGTRSLDPEESAELARLAAEAGKLGEAESAVRLKKLLDLPEDARIVAFDDQKISSTRGMLQSLAKNLSEMSEGGGHFGTISFSSNAGNTRMYLMAGIPSHDEQ